MPIVYYYNSLIVTNIYVHVARVIYLSLHVIIAPKFRSKDSRVYESQIVEPGTRIN